jgi:hypothetical protein
MSWLRRLLAWLFPTPLAVLTQEAVKLGKVTIQQVDGEHGIEWMCSIRANQKMPARYAWNATAGDIGEAMELAIKEARENPIEVIGGAAYRPKLGGAEFDPE